SVSHGDSIDDGMIRPHEGRIDALREVIATNCRYFYGTRELAMVHFNRAIADRVVDALHLTW
ncbi:MAG: hypothetical protein P8178_17000, partial [Candidatus Thiodiazotropha sp.]